MNTRSLKVAWNRYREAERAPGDHLDIRLLDSYHRDLLPADEEAAVRRHIVLCRDCRNLLLDLVSFLEDDGSEGRVWSAEVVAAWHDWQDELKKREQEAAAQALEDVTT